MNSYGVKQEQARVLVHASTGFRLTLLVLDPPVLVLPTDSTFTSHMPLTYPISLLVRISVPQERVLQLRLQCRVRGSLLGLFLNLVPAFAVRHEPDGAKNQTSIQNSPRPRLRIWPLLRYLHASVVRELTNLRAS